MYSRVKDADEFKSEFGRAWRETIEWDVEMDVVLGMVLDQEQNESIERNGCCDVNIDGDTYTLEEDTDFIECGMQPSMPPVIYTSY